MEKKPVPARLSYIEQQEHTPYLSHHDALLATRLSKPPMHTQWVVRSHLLERLRQITTRSLTLIVAPAGFGKTTLLSEWCALPDKHNQATHRSAVTTADHTIRSTVRTNHTERTLSALPSLRTGATPVSWLSLDENENIPISFWHYIITALETIQEGIGEAALSLLFSVQPPPISVILTVLINALNTIPRDFVLVLDDYHVIEEPTIHEAMTFFLHHMPQQMHLVIASRTDPPFPLARLRARLSLLELRTRDLRFTLDETAEFLQRTMELTLSHEEIATLEGRYEGWVTGLQLAALALKEQEDSTHFMDDFSVSVSEPKLEPAPFPHRYIIDYLVEEVLTHQPLEVRDFLLQTSILEHMNGPLCDALTEGNRGQATLRLLERKSLFVSPLDGKREWYRYHHLFAEVLRVMLQQSQPGSIPPLHMRASEWYADNGYIRKAIEHALSAAEFERAACLIERLATASRWMLEELGALPRWLAYLPENVKQVHPLLCVLHVWTLWQQIPSSSQVFEMIGARLDEVAHALKTHEYSDRVVYGGWAALSAAAAFIQRDDARTIDLAQRALELLPLDYIALRVLATQSLINASRQSSKMALTYRALEELVAISHAANDIFSAIRATFQLAQLYHLKGDLHQAAETYRQVLHLSESRSLPIKPNGAFVGLSDILLEWNDVAGATTYLEQVMQQTDSKIDPGIVLYGYEVLIRLRWTQGDMRGAYAAVDEAIRQLKMHAVFSQGSLGDDYRHALVAIQAHLHLISGDQAAANHWAQTRPPQIAAPFSLLHQSELSVLARVYLANRQFEECQQLLQRLLCLAEETQNSGQIITLLALQALAFSTQGERDNALTVLARALALAEPGGYIQTFVREGASMKSLLEAFQSARLRSKLLSQHAVAPEYLQRLLAIFDEARHTPTDLPLEQKTARAIKQSERESALSSMAPLSMRELEVLRLMAEGFSNREIAERLVLAEGTVKTHARRIYAKLDVKNRLYAIRLAREMHLL